MAFQVCYNAGMDTKLPRDFKGVWIPKEIWLAPDLSLMEKVLFVEIHSLDNQRGCFASNQHFARFFGVSDRLIRGYLATLRDKGYVTIQVANFNERVIRAAGRFARVQDGAYRKFRAEFRTTVDNLRVRSMGGGRKLPGG